MGGLLNFYSNPLAALLNSSIAKLGSLEMISFDLIGNKAR